MRGLVLGFQLKLVQKQGNKELNREKFGIEISTRFNLSLNY